MSIQLHGGAQYPGGIQYGVERLSWIPGGLLVQYPGGYLKYSGGYLEYHGGCPVL